MKRIMLVVSVFLMNTLLGKAQNNNPQNVIPPSPEIAAFAKYVDIPVSYATGVPDISIPLYTIKNVQLEIPISLSYNASGIKVEEAATWVGLGWTLQAGGYISRVVRGMPDEHSYGYRNAVAEKKVKYLQPLSLAQEDKRIAFDDVALSLADLEPDIYNFSVMGYSGKFMYNQDSAKFVLIPYQNLQIEEYLAGFLITLPSGKKCYFGQSYDGQRTAYEKPISTTTYSYFNGVLSEPVSYQNHISMWCLMDIYTTDGRSTHFYYENESVIDFGRSSETRVLAENSVTGSQGWQNTITYYKSLTSKPVLKRISSSGISVYFIANTPREDVYNNGSKRLDSVIVKTNDSAVVRKIALNYGYFTSLDVSNIPAMTAFNDVAAKRLKLLSVQVIGNGIAMPPHSFVYDTVPLPNRLSNAQDYWGYYNGHNENTTLIPYLNNILYLKKDPYYSNRNIDTIKSQAGILKEVIYPTGGKTIYHYEQNDASILYYRPLSGFTRPDLQDKQYNFPLSGPIPGGQDVYYYSQEITIGNVFEDVYINASLGGCLYGYNSEECRHYFKIRGLTSPYEYELRQSNEFLLTLPKGKYLLIDSIRNDGTGPLPPASVILRWREIPDSLSILAGGLRLKKVVSITGDGTGISRSYLYRGFGSNSSSGILEGTPVHYYLVPTDYSVMMVNDGYEQKATETDCNGDNCQDNLSLLTLAASSQASLTPDGKIIHYQFVSEFYDSLRTSFRTDYAFENDWDYQTALTGTKLMVPAVSKEWRKTLLYKKQFEKIGNEYRIMQEDYTYYKSFRLLTEVAGIRCTFAPQSPSYPGYYGPSFNTGDITSYQSATEWYLPDSTYSKYYSYANGQTNVMESTSKTTYREYTNRFLPVSTSTINSRGELVVTNTTYPFDYELQPLAVSLIQNGIIEVPVKQETTVNGKIIRGTLNIYNSEGFPTNIYNYESNSLNTPATHNPSSFIEPFYMHKTTIDYSGANIIRITPSNSYNLSYLWDFYGNYPYMEVKNAGGYTSYFSSFESNALGNWNGLVPMGIINGGITGIKCYQLSAGNITANLTGNVNYELTYWVSQSQPLSIIGTVGSPIYIRSTTRDNTVWYCYKHKISGVSFLSLSGTALIDEVRLCVSGAQMQTYSFDPVVGITAACDANNRITYYEYDGLGRLKLIRDADRNIIKKICYNFYGQTTECSETLNLPAPPDPCATCTGPDKMCINGVCVTGVKIYTGSIRLNRTQWQCSYIYRFDDNNISETFTEISNSPCAF